LEGRPREAREKRTHSQSIEPTLSVLLRLLEFWTNQIVPSPNQHHILIVSHGGALRSLVESGLIENLEFQPPHDLPKNYSFANCSITTVQINEQSKLLTSIANVDHLVGKIDASNLNADEINVA
jgi:broad specificity phosphatase PhoE